MRTARIVEDGAAYYHVMSRVVDRRRVFDDGEKELFRKTMRAVEGFSGTKILTWTAMETPISAKSGWILG
jgi:REP element-mobilizing transposase RayT